MNTSTLTKPIAGVTALAVVLASLLAFFAFDARPAGAQSPDIRVNPVEVNLGDVANGEVDTTTITLTNRSDDEQVVELGEIELKLLDGSLEGFDLSFIDPDNGDVLLDLDGILGGLGLELSDLLTDLLDDGLLELEIPDGELVLQPGQTIELVLGLAPDQVGDLNLNIDLLEQLNDQLERIVTIPVAGVAHECMTLSQPATTGDDNLEDPTTGDDVVCGLEGNDTIRSVNGGQDIFVGGPGDDILKVKDRAKKDVASGGSGKDTCIKDKKDKKVNCDSKKKRR